MANVTMVYPPNGRTAIVDQQAFTAVWQPLGWQLASGQVNALPLVIVYQGAWVSGQAYNAGDMVIYSSSTYVALVPSTGVTPSSDATKWTPIGGGSGSGFALTTDPRFPTDNVRGYAATAAQLAVLGNGASKPLSNYYSTLAAAQSAYPHAGALTDELDWAVIQAALNAVRRVYVPAGQYRTNRALTTRLGTRLIGEASAGDSTTPLSQIDAWIAAGVDAISVPTPAGVGSGSGTVIEHLWINGHAAASSDIEGFPLTAVRAASQASDGVIRDCRISGFTFNAVLMDACVRWRFERVWFGGSVRGNLVIRAGSQQIVVEKCQLTVPNETGTAAGTASLQNIWLQNVSGQFPYQVVVRDCLIDEVARSGQTTTPVTIRIERGDDVAIDDCIVWTPINGNSFTPNGGGIGVLIGPSSKRVKLRGTKVVPYAIDANHVPQATISIDATASGCSLSDVATNANGGGDILDSAPDTEYRNVNGKTPRIDALGGISRSAAYIGPDFATISTMALNTSALAYAVPVSIPRKLTVTQLAIEVTTAGDASSVIRLGIYADSGSGYPGALILDAGTVASATTGVKTITVSQALAAGMVWLVAVHQVGATPANVRSGSSPRIPIRPATWQTSTASAFRDVSGGMTGALPGTWSATENVNPTAPIIRALVA